MRFKRHLELEHGLGPIDIVPLINIIFLLLIFFILASAFVTGPVIKMNLPKVITGGAFERGNIEITVLSDNTIFLGSRAVGKQELKNFLKQIAKKGPPILIKSDRKASLGKVAEIFDMCRDFGATQVDIVTDQE